MQAEKQDDLSVFYSPTGFLTDIPNVNDRSIPSLMNIGSRVARPYGDQGFDPEVRRGVLELSMSS